MMLPGKYEAMLSQNTSALQVAAAMGDTALLMAAGVGLVMGLLWAGDRIMASHPENRAQARWQQVEPEITRRLDQHARQELGVGLNTAAPPTNGLRTERESTGPAGNELTTVTNTLTYRLDPPGTGSLEATYVVRFQKTTPETEGPARSTTVLAEEYLDLNSVRLNLAAEPAPMRPQTAR